MENKEERITIFGITATLEQHEWLAKVLSDGWKQALLRPTLLQQLHDGRKPLENKT